MDTNKILILLAGVLIGAVAYSELKKRKKRKKSEELVSGGPIPDDVPANIDFEAICTDKLNAQLAVIRPGAGFDMEKYKADFMTDCIAKKGIV